jgi:hypothetical protein
MNTNRAGKLVGTIAAVATIGAVTAAPASAQGGATF